MVQGMATSSFKNKLYILVNFMEGKYYHLYPSLKHGGCSLFSVSNVNSFVWLHHFWPINNKIKLIKHFFFILIQRDS